MLLTPIKVIALMIMLAAVIAIPAKAATHPELALKGYHHGLVEHVVDGDTISATIHAFPQEFRHMGIRVYGIDAPESIKTNAKCQQEVDLGLKAKAYLASLLPAGTKIEILPRGRDKYFRILAEVRSSKKDIGQAMIAAGLAKPYFGATKPDWCSSAIRRLLQLHRPGQAPK